MAAGLARVVHWPSGKSMYVRGAEVEARISGLSALTWFALAACGGEVTGAGCDTGTTEANGQCVPIVTPRTSAAGGATGTASTSSGGVSAIGETATGGISVVPGATGGISAVAGATGGISAVPGATGAAGAGAVQPSIGWVVLGESGAGEAFEFAFVAVGFIRAGDNSGSCRTLLDTGQCQLLECPTTTSVTSLDGGMVRVTGLRTIEVERGEDGAYGVPVIDGLLWTAGQWIAVEVAGRDGDPPAFATKLEGSGPVSLLVPSPSSTVTLAAGEALTLSWQGGIGDTVVLAPTTAYGRRFACRWPLAAGSAVVPATILAGLPPGRYDLGVSSESVGDVAQVGAWTFNVSTTIPAASFSVSLGSGGT